MNNLIPKSKIIKGCILFVVYVAIFIFLLKYISSNQEVMSRITSASPLYVGLGMTCTCLSMILTGLMDVTCAKAYNIRIRCWESVVLTYLSATLNLIFPLQMGSIVKAVYFKKKINLGYTKYVSILSGTTVINLMVTFVILIGCLILSSLRWNLESYLIFLLILIFVIALLSFALVIKFQDVVLRFLPFKKISVPIMQGFFMLLSNRRAMILTALNLLFSSLLGGIRFALIFKMLGFSGGLLNGLLYYGVYTASTIMPILPGNIGISEMLVGLLNTILGSDFDIGVTVVLVNRIYYYIISILGSILAIYPLMKRCFSFQN
ncbi:lysylphosphatidylglycerol synthase transmembrane domain-containing protein [uncultured Subdoligranulum sp.]|uniref:lysylphosphatidylglycerol synthase transmembrane domain-containing protein n=1 Tax=uncultured Subdoligranulum sp. TaxID=512298 RepID=UPI0025F4A07E|nr:lysylphosphatidylglycerol synthase transmembrane domain-containing protein [uncultured Subdoligranulum sp.]